MTRRPSIASLVAAALVAVALLGVTTPVCAMPACDDTGVGSCSDFKPACGDCPDSIVMKHAPDEAVTAQAPVQEPLAVLAVLAAPEAPPVTGPTDAEVLVTASPPPLDPLGVRLTI